MEKIFKQFTLGNLIKDIHNGKAYNNEDLFAADSEIGISYITRTDSNNGIKKYVMEDGLSGVEEANAITIGDTTATIFFQDRKFVVGPHIIVLRADWMNESRCAYIISLLNSAKEKYPVFARAYTKDLIAQTVIPLPIKQQDNGEPLIDETYNYSKRGYLPDWEYIEKYIAKLSINITSIPDYFIDEGYGKACWYLDNIDQEKFEEKYAGIKKESKISLNDREWKKFRLGDDKYFLIERGDSKYLKNMSSGDVPYISTTCENNGIKAYVLDENRKGNLISLAYDGSIGTCFYQESSFFASEKIVTIDIIPYRLNKYIAFFIIEILKLESKMYSYGGRKWTVEQQLKNTMIQLPVNNNDEPDWEFMEDYIKARPFSCNI